MPCKKNAGLFWCLLSHQVEDLMQHNQSQEPRYSKIEENSNWNLPGVRWYVRKGRLGQGPFCQPRLEEDVRRLQQKLNEEPIIYRRKVSCGYKSNLILDDFKWLIFSFCSFWFHWKLLLWCWQMIAINEVPSVWQGDGGRFRWRRRTCHTAWTCRNWCHWVVHRCAHYVLHPFLQPLLWIWAFQKDSAQPEKYWSTWELEI